MWPTELLQLGPAASCSSGMSTLFASPMHNCHLTCGPVPSHLNLHTPPLLTQYCSHSLHDALFSLSAHSPVTLLYFTPIPSALTWTAH
jgi:hypothetical protein